MKYKFYLRDTKSPRNFEICEITKAEDSTSTVLIYLSCRLQSPAGTQEVQFSGVLFGLRILSSHLDNGAATTPVAMSLITF